MSVAIPRINTLHCQAKHVSITLSCQTDTVNCSNLHCYFFFFQKAIFISTVQNVTKIPLERCARFKDSE